MGLSTIDGAFPCRRSLLMTKEHVCKLPMRLNDRVLQTWQQPACPKPSIAILVVELAEAGFFFGQRRIRKQARQVYN